MGDVAIKLTLSFNVYLNNCIPMFICLDKFVLIVLMGSIARKINMLRGLVKEQNLPSMECCIVGLDHHLPLPFELQGLLE